MVNQRKTVNTIEQKHSNNKGFQPGNQYGKVPKAGKGVGPKKTPQTQVRDWEKEHPEAVYQLLTTLYEKGLEGEKDCAIYVIDRLRGRPSNETKLQIKGSITYSPEEYMELGTEINEIQSKESSFLKDNAPKLLNPGTQA